MKNRLIGLFSAEEIKTKEIIYQMVDNNFPLSTEQFQKEIEIIPLIKDKTTLHIRYKTRYIHILVSETMTQSEIFNLGKRLSIIEQRIIDKSKELYNNTVNRGIINSNCNNAELLLINIENILKFNKINNLKELRQIIIDKIKDYKKSKVKPKIRNKKYV